MLPSLLAPVGILPNEAKPQDTASYIAYQSEAIEYDSALAVAIAWSESRLNPYAKNPDSTASGIFQFLRGTWNRNCEGSVWNASDNIICGVSLLQSEGYIHWMASFDSWYPLYVELTLARSRVKLAALEM